MKKLLIIDDDSTLLRVYHDYFQKLGYDVTTASDGEMGLAQARATRPDCLLLDVMMPKMDGLAMLQQLRKDAMLAETPVILLTNLEDTTTVSQAVQLGGFQYLVKSRSSLQDVADKVAEVIKS